MNAMTWWDHSTESVWSQVWGQAIAGPLKGTTLELIPASIVPWKTWRDTHPNTQALNTQAYGHFGGQPPMDEWVIGVTIDDHQKAYYFTDLVEAGLINDNLGSQPIVIYANPKTRNVYVYHRRVDTKPRSFALDDSGEFLIDQDSGEKWSLDRGLPQQNTPGAQPLLQLPYISAFDWAWLDFYSETAFYRTYRGKKPVNPRSTGFEYDGQ